MILSGGVVVAFTGRPERRLSVSSSSNELSECPSQSALVAAM
jgi:hypothetical protein